MLSYLVEADNHKIASSFAYEHIVIQTKTYYKYDILKVVAKTIVQITANPSYNFV